MISQATTEALKLPEANEFTPGQVDLAQVLAIARAHCGDREATIEAIRAQYFHASAALRVTAAERERQQRTRANNVLVGMSAYGLYSLAENRLTSLGEQIDALPTPAEQVRALARQILLKKHGLFVLRVVRAMQAGAQAVTKQSLADELRSRGFQLPRATTYHTKLLQWLRVAGVLRNYEVDEGAVLSISGQSLVDAEAWEDLPEPAKALLQTFRRITEARGAVTMPMRELVDVAITEHGSHHFPDDQLRARVLDPLIAGGWVDPPVPQSRGRGGKSGSITPTEKLLTTDFSRLTGYPAPAMPPEVRRKGAVPLVEVYRDLDSESRHQKGIALEVLAVRIATDLSLSPVRFRLRGVKTGGAEVDLVAEAAHLHFSRWLFQCKNTGLVTVEDLAREIGMATVLRAQVIVLVTMGRFSRAVTDLSGQVARESAFQVVLVDGGLVRSYRDRGGIALRSYFHSRATNTMVTKTRQIDEAIGEPGA